MARDDPVSPGRSASRVFFFPGGGIAIMFDQTPILRCGRQPHPDPCCEPVLAARARSQVSRGIIGAARRNRVERALVCRRYKLANLLFKSSNRMAVIVSLLDEIRT